MRKALLLLGLFAALAGPRTARATEGETEWSAGVSTGYWGSAVLGIDVGWLYDATDFVAVGASVRDRHLRFDPARGDAAVTADLRVVLDALTWIPALAVGIGPSWTRDGFSPFFRGEAALGYRPQRTWGLVGRVAYEGPGWRGHELRWVVGVGVVWYRGAGIGLDL